MIVHPHSLRSLHRWGEGTTGNFAATDTRYRSDVYSWGMHTCTNNVVPPGFPLPSGLTLPQALSIPRTTATYMPAGQQGRKQEMRKSRLSTPDNRCKEKHSRARSGPVGK